MMAALALAGGTLAAGAYPLGQAGVPPSPSVAATEPTDKARLVELVWPAPVSLQLDDSGDELVVRFDRPLSEDAIAAFRRAAGDDLARFDWNDTSLVLRAAPGRSASAAIMSDRLRITFTLERNAVATSDEVERGYELAAAAADAAAGYPGRAQRRLARLAVAYPKDPQIGRAIADADLARGARGLAADRYRDLDARDPLARAALRSAAGDAAFVSTYRSGKGFSQGEAFVRAGLPVSTLTTLNIWARGLRTRADQAVRRDGSLVRVRSKAALIDATLNVVPAAAGRFDLMLSSRVDQPQLGAGIRATFGPAEQEGRFLLAFHLPNVAVAEETILGGSIDRLGLGGTLRLSPEMTIQADGALNIYRLRREGQVGRSVTVLAGADYTFRRREPYVSLTYRMDAEYVDRLDRRPNGLAALPLANRENHTLQAIISGNLGQTRLTGAGGWTVDRYGGTGPTVTGTATRPIGKDWRLELAGGVTSVSRAGLTGKQLFLRMQIARSFGRS